MDKTIAGLLGAVAGLAAAAPAHATTSPAADPSQALQASSYADLLEPIPNAVEVLKADDRARADEEAAEFQLAQGYYYPYPNYRYSYPYYGGGYYGRPYWHHHHHHHRYHHHHHHHHGAVIGIPGVGAVHIR